MLCSAAITKKWNANYQLVPPNTHQSNAAERTIRTFKAHFLSILAGCAPNSPRNLWEILVPQTELTLNLLRHATLDPTRSEWSYFHGPFNYVKTPIRPLGCDIIAHKKTGTRHSWDFRGAAGWNVGVALQHYFCYTIMAKSTWVAQISDTVEFRHHRLTQPTVTPMDCIVHGVKKFTCDLHNTPHIACDNKLLLIEAINQDIQRWKKTTRPPQTKPHRTTLTHTRTKPRSILRPMRRPQENRPPDSTPRVVIQKPTALLILQLSISSQDEPIAWHTRSRFPSMDRTPSRVNKTTNTVPIARRTSSQTAAMASVITPAQAAQMTISIQVSSKSINARPRRNFWAIVTIPPTWYRA